MASEDPVRAESILELADDEGGDAVCWAHLVCPECGAVTTEGHRPGCQSAKDEQVHDDLYNQKLYKLYRT